MKLTTVIGLGIAGVCCLNSSCGTKTTEVTAASFTEVDSLTEVYLDLQDSIIMSWNLMINDDNKKIKSMYNLLHELRVVGQFDPEQIKALEERIGQLKKIRYTSKTLSDSETIDEYDFASNSLVTELIALAESFPAFSYNSTLQQLVEHIRLAEQRIENYRLTYDSVVIAYNNFLATHKDLMEEIDHTNTLEKKPLFQMASD